MVKFVILRSGGLTYWVNPSHVRRIDSVDTMPNDCTLVFDDNDKVHLAMSVAAVVGVLSQ